MLQADMQTLMDDYAVKLFLIHLGHEVRIEHQATAIRGGGRDRLILAPRGVDQKSPEKGRLLKQFYPGFRESVFERDGGHGEVLRKKKGRRVCRPVDLISAEALGISARIS
jgi:hypothetical protein